MPIAEATAVLRPPVARKEPARSRSTATPMTDDYYWLRNKGTPEVETHLKAELAYAEAFMKPTAALQQKLYDEMLSRIQQTDVNVPYRDRGYFYYSRTEEGKQYPIFCRKKGSLDAPEEVILDVNALAEGKEFMSVGDDGGEPGRQPPRLHHGRDRLPPVHAAREGPAARASIGPGSDRARHVRRVGGGRQDALFYAVEDPQTKRIVPGASGTRWARARDDLVYEEKDERFMVDVSKSRDDKYLFIDSEQPDTTARSGTCPRTTRAAELEGRGAAHRRPAVRRRPPRRHRSGSARTTRAATSGW